MTTLVLENIKKVQELYSANLANKYLKEGWILLEIKTYLYRNGSEHEEAKAIYILGNEYESAKEHTYHRFGKLSQDSTDHNLSEDTKQDDK